MVSYDEKKVVGNVVESVLVVELEGGWLWMLCVLPELLERGELELVEVKQLQMLVCDACHCTFTLIP